MLMITVTIPESFNEKTNEFLDAKQYTLKLEHSLLSVSKWESKWKKAYLTNEQKTPEEMLDYIKFMIINKVPEYVVNYISENDIRSIYEYINSEQTATVIKDYSPQQNKKNKEVITSELIYFWMSSYRIPFEECQKWHLSRLFALLEIASIKNAPPKKMSKREIMANNAKLNAERRKALHSKG